MFKVNILEYIQVFFFSYGTLADFVCCFGTLAVTVIFVILSTLAR